MHHYAPLQSVTANPELVSAGLFIRSLREAYKVNLGFDPDHVLLASFDPFLSGYDENRGREFYRRLVEGVRTLPGIQSSTLARRLPLTLGGIAFANVTIDGYTPSPAEDIRSIMGPSVPTTLKPCISRWRKDGTSTKRDHERAPRVVVINETMARRYWPKESALGHRLKLADEWLEIVGVAKDVKNRSLSESPKPFLYLPLFQDYRSNMILVARTTVDRGEAFRAVQTEVAVLDKRMPIFDVETFEEHIGVALFLQRMAATLLTIFGLLALSLAGLGLYGVVAYSVSQRTREPGIRISVGASKGDVLKLILGQALMLAAVG